MVCRKIITRGWFQIIVNMFNIPKINMTICHNLSISHSTCQNVSNANLMIMAYFGFHKVKIYSALSK